MELVDCLGNPRPEKKVLIPEFRDEDGNPSEVRVRLLTVRHQIAFENCVTADRKDDALIVCVLHACVKADGSPMFNDEGDVEGLPGLVAMRIFTAHQELQEQSADLEGIKKKSRTARRLKSRSNSPQS